MCAVCETRPTCPMLDAMMHIRYKRICGQPGRDPTMMSMPRSKCLELFIVDDSSNHISFHMLVLGAKKNGWWVGFGEFNVEILARNECQFYVHVEQMVRSVMKRHVICT